MQEINRPAGQKRRQVAHFIRVSAAISSLPSAVLIVTIVGIAFYLAFLMTVDVPMYLNRWRADVADGNPLLHPLEGLRDVRTRWIVTHDLAEWKEEMAWMSLYFSLAVWSSLALCVFYSLGDQLPRYRTSPVASISSHAPAVVATQPAVIMLHRG